MGANKTTPRTTPLTTPLTTRIGTTSAAFFRARSYVGWPERARAFGLLALAGLSLAACALIPGSAPVLGPASPGQLAQNACAALTTAFVHPATVIGSATVAPAATFRLPPAGQPFELPEHCVVVGRMNERVSPVDGKPYAIGFEMRLPRQWNGRFYYQANGGIDGNVVPAIGNPLGAAPVSSALNQGFAVISSDAGHPGSYGPFFGLDPQARLDYGYNAVAQLTPMAKAMIRAAYGRVPDRSYLGGCSNGGRHAMVAAARFADQYDGFLAGNPGFNLPKAAVAQLFGAAQYATIAAPGANGQPDITTAVTPAEFQLIGKSVLGKCDALDGALDGIVADTLACQRAFRLTRDVPTCSGARDGTCLSGAQKTVLENIMAGPRLQIGRPIYSHFWFDPGISGANWRFWEYTAAQNLDPGSVSIIFSTPPMSVAAFTARTGLQHAQSFGMDTDSGKILATTPTYPVAAMDFMTPPNPTNLARMRDRGAKMIVFHGVADAVFSSADTASWYGSLDAANQGRANLFARLFLVPGMNHCSGGPATDQFDLLSPLVEWVEKGVAPQSVTARARGPGANVVNPEVPADWSPARTRPLCAYPAVARYNGTGSLEEAASFTCR